MRKLVLLLVCVVVVCVHGRHLHPHVAAEGQWETNVETGSAPQKEENVEVELIRHMKPTRFVPINNAIFFMGYLPCEDGFKRDYMGICREVWD